MTVSTTDSQIPYTGDGSSVNFAFPYYFLQNTDVQVYINGSLQVGGYTVTGAGNQAGGNVSFSTPPVAGAQIVLSRSPDTLQSTHLPPNDPFPASTVEQALDKLTMLVQNLTAKAARALTFPLYEQVSGALAGATARASKILGFDVNGNVSYVPLPASVGAGNLTDEVGLGGTPGFAAGVDFTPNVSTSLLLSQAYGSKSNILVFFDASFQAPDQYSLTGSTLTFNSPIPSGVSKVYVRGGTTLSLSQPATGSVGTSQLSDRAVTDPKVAAGSKLYNRNTDVMHATDFGAKFDGVTDDTAALQAALNALTSGKELILPAGVTITSPLKPPIMPGGGTGYRVRGAGVGNTIFREKTPNTGIFTAPSGIVFGAEFSGFSLQPHASANGGGCGFLISGYENCDFEKIGYLSNGAGYWANLFKLSASPELSYGNTIAGVHIFGQVGPSVPISFDNNGAGINYNANACRIVGGIIANNTRVATCIDATKSINTVIDRVWLESNFLSTSITGNKADASTGINSGEGTLIIGNYLERLSPYINYPNLVDGTSNNGLVTGNTFSPTWTTTTTFFNGAKNNLWVGNNEGGLPIQFVGASESNRKIGATLTKAQAALQAPSISYVSGVGGTPTVGATVTDVDLNGDITYELGLSWITGSGGANQASTFSLGSVTRYELKSLVVTANMPTTNNCPVPCSAAASSATFSVAIPAATTYGIQVKAILKKTW